MGWEKNPVFYAANQVAMLHVRDALNFFPRLIRHKFGPGIPHGWLIRPGQQIDKFGTAMDLRFPHRSDIKTVGPHYSRCMVSKTVVECGFVVFKNFVDSELMDHGLYYTHVSTHPRWSVSRKKGMRGGCPIPLIPFFPNLLRLVSFSTE